MESTYDTTTLGKAKRGEGPLTPYTYQEFKPETVSSWELGYIGIIDHNLFIDVFGFYAQYTNFIGLTILLKNPLQPGFTPSRFNTFGIYTNSSNKVNTVGAGLSLQYTLPRGFSSEEM